MDICPYCATALQHNPSNCPNCGASLRPQHLERGALIAAKYRVESVLGQGGFGITYLATDTQLEHRVAIKELFPDGSTRSGTHVRPPPGLDFLETKRKFLEEARVVQRFHHPNIVRVYGTLEENDTAYIVMEVLEGSTLGSDVSSNGPFPERTVLEMARQLCEALEVVHDAGLLHRDIKPDNVFLASDNRVVLIDFGSARDFARGQVKKHTRLVTPGYAAPEQYATQATFGAYTDVYGLAATLYFALEGRMPPLATELMLGATLEFRNANRLRQGLEAGMQVKVDQRPQSVHAFIESLEQKEVTSRVEPPPTPVSSTSSVMKAAKNVMVRSVHGWHFDQHMFRRDNRLYRYNSVQMIEVTEERRQPIQKHEEWKFGLILGGVICLLAFITRELSIALVAFYAVFGGTWISIQKAIRAKPEYDHVVWITVLGNRERLTHYKDRQEAEGLAQALRQATRAKLYLP
jgi:serine/threonine protein kinase